MAQPSVTPLMKLSNDPHTPFFVERLPLWTYIGLVLNLVAWFSAWSRVGPWPYMFFPIWFGFILVLDGLNVARRGTSILTRSWWRFALLFVYSAPAWWTFEGVNSPMHDWHYRLDHLYTSFEYGAWSTIAFSTVLPAVMEMTELLTSWSRFQPRLGPDEVGRRASVRTTFILICVGLLSTLLVFTEPTYAYPLAWGCLVFTLDPLNNALGRKSALAHYFARDWGFLIALPLATLVCGFFWEMWNWRSLPNWYYTVPFLDKGPHLFEMPLPGFIGYLPFGLELFAMYQFALIITRQKGDGLII